nr:Protein T22F3.11, isoform a [Haemonchus contortus]
MVTVTLLLVYAPTYFHVVLGYDIPTTGVLVSFAASIHLPLKFVGGVLSDRIRQYAHFVLATIQFMKCVALFVAPATVALLVQDERRHDQWRYVYWINGVLLIAANFIFIPIATDKPASFTLITRATRNEDTASSSADKEVSARGRASMSRDNAKNVNVAGEV